MDEMTLWYVKVYSKNVSLYKRNDPLAQAIDYLSLFGQPIAFYSREQATVAAESIDTGEYAVALVQRTSWTNEDAGCGEVVIHEHDLPLQG